MKIIFLKHFEEFSFFQRPNEVKLAVSKRSASISFQNFWYIVSSFMEPTSFRLRCRKRLCISGFLSKALRSKHALKYIQRWKKTNLLHEHLRRRLYLVFLKPQTVFVSSFDSFWLSLQLILNFILGWYICREVLGRIHQGGFQTSISTVNMVQFSRLWNRRSRRPETNPHDFLTEVFYYSEDPLVCNASILKFLFGRFPTKLLCLLCHMFKRSVVPDFYIVSVTSSPFNKILNILHFNEKVKYKPDFFTALVRIRFSFFPYFK